MTDRETTPIEEKAVRGESSERPPSEEGTGPSPAKRLYLAGLGAAALLREESRRAFEHLVARGTPLEEPVRRRTRAIRAEIESDLAGARAAAGRAFGRFFGRYAAPPKEEIDELKQAVERVGARVEELS